MVSAKKLRFNYACAGFLVAFRLINMALNNTFEIQVPLNTTRPASRSKGVVNSHVTVDPPAGVSILRDYKHSFSRPGHFQYV